MKNKKNRNIVIATFLTVIAVVMIIAIGPVDMFTHGHYSDVVDPTNIDKEDFYKKIDLKEKSYRGEFTTKSNNFNGFELWLDDVSENTDGLLKVTILGNKDEVLDLITIKLSEIKSQQWYNAYLKTKLDKGKKYEYTIEVKNCKIHPKLQIVNKDYLENQNSKDGLLIGYTYAKSTFSFGEKVLIIIFICSIWLVSIKKLLFNRKNTKYFDVLLEILFFTFILSWNYMFNTFDDKNVAFKSFEEESETLVTGVIKAEKNKIKSNISTTYEYGLGRYTDLVGEHHVSDMEFMTDNEWNEGYSRKNPQLLIPKTELSQQVTIKGNHIKFKNGDQFNIINQEEERDNLIITLKSKKPLNPYKYGSILESKIYDKDGQQIKTESLAPYTSQYGLQAKIFKHIAKYMRVEDVLEVFHAWTALITGCVFAIVILLIKKKYNYLMSICFGAIFLLSPWIVNFARNLYWLEFLWFIPMAIGLFCANNIQNRKYRIWSYITMFISILIKCLCGYEYITVIMLASIAFLLADALTSFILKKKSYFFLSLRTIFILGCMELAGFFTAIGFDARVRGQGNLLVGIKYIIQTMRARTLGGNLNSMELLAMKEACNISNWEVFRTYFHFNTDIIHSEIIVGVAGELFPLLCIRPIIIFIYNYKKEKIDWNVAALYVLLFITCTSWYILGKQHSYCHRHLNYVLWYFGYVQICFYIILREIITFFNKGKGVKE